MAVLPTIFIFPVFEPFSLFMFFFYLYGKSNSATYMSSWLDTQTTPK